MTGNPCTQIEGYRKFVIALLPSVAKLDGQDVTPSERTEAAQEFAQIKRVIESKAQEEDLLPPHISESDSEDEPEPEAEPSQFVGFRKTPKIKPATPGLEKDKYGKVGQCNQGGYDFNIEELDEEILVEVKVSKFLDTSLIDADIHPDFVRVTIKGKVLQLCLPCEVRTDTAVAQRSQTTGSLVLRCPRLHPVMRRKHKLVGVAPDPSGTDQHYHGPAAVSANATKVSTESRGTAPGEFKAIAKESENAQVHDHIREWSKPSVDSDVDDDAPPDW